jgi:hypothetical protein
MAEDHMERRGHMLTMSQRNLNTSLPYKVIIRRERVEFSFLEVDKFLLEAAQFDFADCDKDIQRYLDQGG